MPRRRAGGQHGDAGEVERRARPRRRSAACRRCRRARRRARRARRRRARRASSGSSQRVLSVGVEAERRSSRCAGRPRGRPGPALRRREPGTARAGRNAARGTAISRRRNSSRPCGHGSSGGTRRPQRHAAGGVERARGVEVGIRTGDVAAVDAGRLEARRHQLQVARRGGRAPVRLAQLALHRERVRLRGARALAELSQPRPPPCRTRSGARSSGISRQALRARARTTRSTAGAGLRAAPSARSVAARSKKKTTAAMIRNEISALKNTPVGEARAVDRERERRRSRACPRSPRSAA